MSILHDDAYYESRKPQPDLGPLRNFKRFLWNAEKKSFLDRTWEAWAQIIIFYLIFFGIILSLFAFQMWVTFTYINSMNRPYIFTARNLRTSYQANEQIPLARTFKEGRFACTNIPTKS